MLWSRPATFGKIKQAVEQKLLAVWTPWHQVTLDSRIEARPERPLPAAAYLHPVD